MAIARDDCGVKHLKLAAWVVALTVTIASSLTVGLVAYQSRASETRSAQIIDMVRDQESRVRANERDNSSFKATLDAMRESLQRIEKAVDSRSAASPG